MAASLPCKNIGDLSREYDVVTALKACSNRRDLQTGKQIHATAIEKGFHANIYIANTLIDLYAKCGSMVEARAVFNGIRRRDAVSWNSLILGYVHDGQYEFALHLFACIGCDGCKADARTFIAALKACTSLGLVEDEYGVTLKTKCLLRGTSIHLQVAMSGHDSNSFVANTLIDMYAKCRSMIDARDVFDRMPFHDVVSWNALILGYAESGESSRAIELFSQMQSEGFCPDAGTFAAALKACSKLAEKEDGEEVNDMLVKECLVKGITVHSQAVRSGYDSQLCVASALMDLYSRCGRMKHAHAVFNRSCHDVVSWNTLIQGYVENGKSEFALQLFAQMQKEDFHPDARTFVAAIKAVANEVAPNAVKDCLSMTRALHRKAANSGCDSNNFVASTLIHTYGKCGSMVDAYGVFDRMLQHDSVSWNALMLGYVENRKSGLALQFLHEMQTEGCLPDARTLVVALKACGILGALEIGKLIHTEICRRGLQHKGFVANTMIDFYGKCGNMALAQKIFDSISTRTIATWNALISGYSRQGNTKHVFDLFKKIRQEGLLANNITFLCILTACSHAGLLEKGKDYFKVMSSDYGVVPNIDHYHCMIDMLGRANRLDDAVNLVKNMSFRSNVVTWLTLLDACRKWKNVAIGRFAFEFLVRLNDKESAAYLLMANIYESVGMLDEKFQIESMARNACVDMKNFPSVRCEFLIKG